MVAALLTGALLAGFAGCAGLTGGGDPETPRGASVEVTARLDAAVAGVDATRAQLLDSAGAVTTGATALDAADEAAAGGGRAAASDARGPARAAVPAAEVALETAPVQVEAYRAALQELSAAALALDGRQRSALQAVVAAGEAEALAQEAFAAAAAQVWPAYAALDEAQSLWLDRAGAGWYRTQSEAADAYAVLLRPQAQPLAQARSVLREADAAPRRPAIDAQRQALSAADAALAPLRAPA